MADKNEPVVVIGAGISGLLTTLALTEAGLAVDLYDASAPGTESSWAGGGIVSPLYPWRYSAPVTALASWSQAFYPSLAQRLFEATGIDPEYDEWGLLMLDPPDADEALAWARLQGRDMCEWPGARLPAMEPAIDSRASRILDMPSVGAIRNPRMIKALLAFLTRHPLVRLHPHEPVLRVMRLGQRVSGIQSTQRVQCASRVVITAGAWSHRLLETVGESAVIKPVRGQMLAFRGIPGLLRHIVLRDGTYLIPRRDGVILVGSTLEFVGFDKQTTAEARDWLQGRAFDLLPALRQCEIIAHWSGLRPGSPAGIPWIGGWPGIDGLFLNAGHYRNGLLLAPAAAHLLADVLLGRTPVVDPVPYRPQSRREAVIAGLDPEWQDQSS